MFVKIWIGGDDGRSVLFVIEQVFHRMVVFWVMHQGFDVKFKELDAEVVKLTNHNDNLRRLSLICGVE
jgi:hypothetical protein